MSVSVGTMRCALICAVVTLALLLGGCRTSAEPQATASPTTVGSPSGPSSPAASPTSGLAGSPSVNDDTLTINITIAGGKTTPSRQKINVRVGQKVISNVTSDTDDEIHAHIGRPGLRAAGACWQAGQAVVHPRHCGQPRSGVSPS
jgi:hypothetical protein